uniref:Uncharacterized protein n=1 Tax=Clytia hemisphaerica TaxID=252671 RepID=A0A7M5U6T7_9CNID
MNVFIFLLEYFYISKLNEVLIHLYWSFFYKFITQFSLVWKMSFVNFDKMADTAAAEQRRGEDTELLHATQNITIKEEGIPQKISLLSDPSSIYSEMLAEVEAEISDDNSGDGENDVYSDHGDGWVTCEENNEWTVHREEISISNALIKQIEKNERSTHPDDVGDKDSTPFEAIEDEIQTKIDTEDRPSESKKIKLDGTDEEAGDKEATSNRVIELATERDGTKLQVNLGPSNAGASQEKVVQYNTIVMERYEMEEQIRKRRRITRNLLKQNIKVRFYEDIEEKYRQQFGPVPDYIPKYK